MMYNTHDYMIFIEVSYEKKDLTSDGQQSHQYHQNKRKI